MPDQRFLKCHHLRRPAEFQRVYERRARASDALILVFGLRNELGHSRIGLSVSRKVGGAVVRNRWKRLLREAFRLTREQLPDDLDMIVIPRRSDPPTLAELMESLPRLARKIRRRLD